MCVCIAGLRIRFFVKRNRFRILPKLSKFTDSNLIVVYLSPIKKNRIRILSPEFRYPVYLLDGRDDLEEVSESAGGTTGLAHPVTMDPVEL